MKKFLQLVFFTGISCMSYGEVRYENTKDRFFPIWGDEARARGYELPKPYGISVIYLGMRQDISVQSIDIDFQNPLIGDLVEGLDLTAKDASVDVDNVSLRADLWVLPFLNIYGILGHTKGVVKAKGSISGEYHIGPWPIPIEIEGVNIDFEYEGITYGGGFILAGGYERFFAMIDTNYTYTKLDIAEGHTKAFITAPRVGYEFTVLGRPLRVWTGAMYQDIEQTIKGDIYDILDLGAGEDIAGAGEFTVKQKGAHPWTYTAGFNLEVTKYWDIVVEAGFGHNNTIMAGSGYRF